MTHLRSLALTVTTLAALGLTIGCSTPSAAPVAKKSASATKPATAPKTVSLTGAVMAPAGVIATGGGNVISTGGGNVISTGGGNYRLLAVEEKPLANTVVFLADAKGVKVPGVEETKTDDKGRYSFAKVPTKGNYVVTARAKTAEGKDAELQSLVKVGTANVAANLGASSTMVTALMLDEMAGDMSAMDTAAFDKAVSAVASQLTAESMPDMSDKAGILTRMKGLKATMSELSGMLDQMRESLPDAAKDALDQAQQQIEDASALMNLE